MVVSMENRIKIGSEEGQHISCIPTRGGKMLSFINLKAPIYVELK